MLQKKEKPEILYIDEQIVVCKKPQGMPVQNDKTRDLSVENFLKNEIAKKQKKENKDSKAPELFVVHRLDRPVGGIMVFARSKQAAADLSKQMQDGSFEKYYQVILSGTLPDEAGELEDYLLKDGKTNTSKVVKKGTKGAKLAQLEYDVLDVIETEDGVFTYALIHLLTGRHHQIRVQCANAGAGIWGDTKYNKDFQKIKRRFLQIGLYATRIEFNHPGTGKHLIFKTDAQGEAFDLLDAIPI